MGPTHYSRSSYTYLQSQQAGWSQSWPLTLKGHTEIWLCYTVMLHLCKSHKLLVFIQHRRYLINDSFWFESSHCFQQTKMSVINSLVNYGFLFLWQFDLGKNADSALIINLLLWRKIMYFCVYFCTYFSLYSEKLTLLTVLRWLRMLALC